MTDIHDVSSFWARPSSRTNPPVSWIEAAPGYSETTRCAPVLFDTWKRRVMVVPGGRLSTM
ncbi:hypothetical protein D7Y13_42180 [Corallococcus praedator]|uniref:Alpha/beta hydrolase n=1 Tax=Corallococcus praedator TaxID=2316724 RepID=A0ABX9Q4E4_9BACT|nr:hypothetical protein D7Y13_42180 [Corallococcus praedator]